ncbi:NAD-dependent epimerase/dehydratase family protein [Caldiplasma sukawensis]
MERMLISGGNGFLGSHLVDKAINEGYNVVVIDDFSTYEKLNLPKSVKIIREKVENTVINDRFEYVIHLAARPSPEDYIRNPVETLMSNSVGTMKLLEVSKMNNSRFLYASSSEVYGNADVLPTPESYNGNVSPCGIRSCYDEGKRYSEALTMAYHRKFNLDTRIQRPFNVYGPRIRPDGIYGRVIPRFIMQALKNEDITIHGDGSQTRSFLFIDDWIDATWKMITQDGINGEIFNIGSTKEFSILEIARLIKKLCKSSSNIVFMERREDDPQRRSADITKAKNLLKWEPQKNIEFGLAKTIEWMRSEIE